MNGVILLSCIISEGSGKKVLVLAVCAETQPQYTAPKAVNSHSRGATDNALMIIRMA